METKYSKNSWLRFFKPASMLALAALLSTLAACGNKNNNNPTPVATAGVIGAYGACAGCASGVNGYLDSALGIVSDGRVTMEIGLQFYGSVNGGVAGGAMGGYFAQTQSYYSGPIMAQGRLYVMSGDSLCPVPPGMYQLTPASQGQLVYGGSFGNMMFQATGPTTMTVMIPSAMVSSQMGAPVVSRIDGSQFRYLITGGTINLGGYSSCTFPIN
jgi:hypothetical protein